MCSNSGGTTRRAGSRSSRRPQTTIPSRSLPGRSSATNSRALGLFGLFLLTPAKLRGGRIRNNTQVSQERKFLPPGGAIQETNDPPERVEPVDAGTTPRATDNHHEISMAISFQRPIPPWREYLRRAPDSNRIPLVKRNDAIISRSQHACLLQPSCEESTDKAFRSRGGSSPPSSIRSRCIPTRAERSRTSARPPGITGSRAIDVPSARRALKQT